MQLHPALEELGGIGAVRELNVAARNKLPIPEPIFITPNGTILTGIGAWRLALFEGSQEIRCFEIAISEDDSLQFILAHHRDRRGWNPFVLICLALRLEPYFQQKALENMRAGGKLKGLANLPDAQHINVREQIAIAAGFGPRSVGSVKTILKVAHPRLIEALKNGTLTINGAMQFCKLSKAEQLERFIQQSEEHATNKVIRRALGRQRKGENRPDAAAVLDALQKQEEQQPGSVVVRVGRLSRTVILIGQDFLTGPHAQGELRLT